MFWETWTAAWVKNSNCQWTWSRGPSPTTHDFGTIHDQTRSNLVVVQVLQNEIRIIPFEVVGDTHSPIHVSKQTIAKIVARVGPLKNPFVPFIVLNHHEVRHVNTRFLHTLKIKEQKLRFLLFFFFLVVILPSLPFTFLFDGFHETPVRFGIVVLLTCSTSGFPALVVHLTSFRHFTALLTFAIRLAHPRVDDSQNIQDLWTCSGTERIGSTNQPPLDWDMRCGGNICICFRKDDGPNPRCCSLFRTSNKNTLGQETQASMLSRRSVHCGSTNKWASPFRGLCR